MANNRRYQTQFMYSLERQPAKAMGAITVGAGPTFTSNSKAISMSAVATGVYRITSAIGFSNLLSASIMLQRSSGPVDLVPQIVSVSSANKTVDIRMLAGAVPTDMATNDVLYIELTLRPSANQ